jgi:hypothetical protein
LASRSQARHRCAGGGCADDPAATLIL